MPSFGSLLKKKKTKETPPPSQGISTVTSPTKDAPATNALSPVTSRQQTGAPLSTTTTATAPPTSSNGPAEQAVAAYSQGPDANTGMDNKVTPRQTKGKYTLVDFEFARTLGTGSFGRVHLVQSKHNQRYYAVKVLKKQQVVKMKQIEHTNDERRMLQRVKHPFLITLWGTFQDPRNLYMVMDFIEGGELFSLLRKSQV